MPLLDLDDIAARASLPAERRSSDWQPLADSPHHRDRIEARRRRWRDRVAAGDESAFARLLAWDHLSDNALRRSLSDGCWNPAAPRTRWITGIEQMVDAVQHSRIDDAPTTAGLLPLPFDALLSPILSVARSRVRCALEPHAYEALSDSAHRSLERALLSQLCELAAAALYAAFAAFRAAQPPALGISLDGSRADRRYRAFIDEQRNGGFAQLLLRYPVLARLLATRVDSWCDATAELLQRLAADRPLLAEQFDIPANTTFVKVRAALSDPHAGGRSVSILSTASGSSIVYKPRSLAPEHAVHTLLHWLGDRGLPFRLGSYPVCDRGTHGWAGCVAPSACRDIDEATRYFQRAGALLGVAYIVGAADLHSGNVISSGEYPMLIDLEVVSGGLVRSERDGDVRGGAHIWRLWNSVLRTGLLPGRGPAADGKSYMEGGLAGDRAEHPVTRRSWRHLNSDLMAPVVEQVVLPSGGGPQLEGHTLDVLAYRDAVLHGLRTTLELFVRHRTTLLDPSGPLQLFRRIQTRTVLRDTRIYDSVLQRATHPRFLEDGIAWATELDVLRSSDTAANREPRFWAARGAEQTELQRLDVPIFTAIADERVLRCGCEIEDVAGDRSVPLAVVPDAFEESGFDELLARVRALDAAEIDRQLAIVRISLTDSAPSPAPRRPARPGPPTAHDRAATLRDEAHRLRVTLERLAVDGGDDGVNWVGFVEQPGQTRAELQPLGFDLFSGRTGIALFFAAIARCHRDESAARLARRALGPLAQGHISPAASFRQVESLDIGGATGIGGIVYALHTVGTLLGDDTLHNSARLLARSITPARIRDDHAFDLTSGSAGALLALRHLRRHRNERWLEEIMQAAIDHLLAARSSDRSGTQRGWRGAHGAMYTGFAHGAAGIAYALEIAARECDMSHADGGAREAIAFIDAHRLDHGGWYEAADGAPPATARPWCSWCHGAAGIGLGRLASDARGGAVDLAVRQTLDAVHPGADHLCCGTLGRAHFLLRAGLARRDHDLVAKARERITGVVDRARERGAYVAGVAPEYAPAFFQGLAGIGYELLRVAHPRTLPSVLTWH
jgi:type 2 lantibiotic biosynthesis protein LanM